MRLRHNASRCGYLRHTTSREKQSMSNDTTIRWGIVGAGRIARRFAQGLAHVPGAVLSGVWSRRPEPARALAAAFGARAFDSFDALMGGIDALYIATMQD